MNFDMRAFAADLCRFASTAGEEAAAADFVEGELDALGFETYAWDADPELLADHPSFPDDIDESDVAGRRSVAGVLALGGSNNGNPRDDAPTIVVNGHIDVVPAEPAEWSSDPFEPVWGESGNKREGNDTVETLTARGAADMKSGARRASARRSTFERRSPPVPLISRTRGSGSSSRRSPARRTAGTEPRPRRSRIPIPSIATPRSSQSRRSFVPWSPARGR